MKKQIDFLFISSPTNATSRHMPYYYLALAGYLTRIGFSCKILDEKWESSDSDFGLSHFSLTVGRTVKKYRPRFVGIAAYTPDYEVVMQLGEWVKQVDPETMLLVGNAHATIRPEDFIFPGSPFDFAVLGEGEETCEDLWNTYYRPKQGQMFSSVPGIAYLNHLGDIKITEPREVLRGCDIVEPYYDLIDTDWYFRPQKDIIRRIYTRCAYVFASRGCPYKCTFCSTNASWDGNCGPKVRQRPVMDVIREICHLRNKYGIDFFYMADDTFGVDKRWMEEFFQAKKRHLKIVPYAIQTRANLMSERMVKRLKDTGCIQVDIGVESGCQDVLDRVKKQITLEQIKQSFEWLQKYKIRSFSCLMFNLPEETEKERNTIMDLVKEIKPTSAIVSLATPYPGTKIHDDYIKGTDFDTKENYWRFKDDRTNEAFNMQLYKEPEDLGEIWKDFDRKLKVQPMFERMWAMWPFQLSYWKAIRGSQRKRDYFKAWGKDLVITFLKWWVKRLGLFGWVKNGRK